MIIITWFRFMAFVDGTDAWEAQRYAIGRSKPNYPVPSTIGRVSIGQDYWRIAFIDDADADDPTIVYCFDQHLKRGI